jgi:hypothetical protein
VIYCTVEPVLGGGGGVLVRTFDGDEPISRRQFSTAVEAQAALRHAGFAEVNGRWCAVLTSVPYVATHMASTMPIKQARLLTTIDSSFASRPWLTDARRLILDKRDIELYLNVVEGVAGYAFKFSFDMLHIDANRDPVLALLTTELIAVEAIGSWPTVEEAEVAGRIFFKRVLELIPEETLLIMLHVLRGRWLCQMQNSR